MQPTPLTRTSFCMPDSTTSILRASRTRSAPLERQPAAMHTQTWCWNFFCASRSASRNFVQFLDGHGWMPFWMRASMSSGAILPSTAESITAAGARPQEPRQRAVSTLNSPSGVVSPGLMPWLPLDRLQQERRALDVAGGPGADHAGVPALGLQGEEVIEGGRTVHAAEGHAQDRGDETQCVLIEIAEALLDGVQGFDEGVRFAPVTACRGLDDFPAFIVGGQLRRSHIRLHNIHIECICTFQSDLSEISASCGELSSAGGSGDLRSWVRPFPGSLGIVARAVTRDRH